MARLNYIVTIIVITLICVLAQELYSDRYDKVDAENILQNNRLRDQYYNCFMGNAPCTTADAKFFKEIIIEAFRSKCKKCTEKQKEMMNLVQDWYKKNKPEQWKAFVAKYQQEER
ncbi:Ejaculatory bulb-specific protein 3 [Trachymyrmex septentrionalis]|uniref:Ejaculatory bulb-specific protein 3 n=1 Tax=Trachymyrmex septentrionalis TaxID=34720 RepID=A0A195FNN1_9HYME|nr:PREDICTED: ejaculatory bulb-specific protein 3-like [Trachymyrmex septentrionalis]KYN42160.1 Ejaculatory bulb-specific protein 3 [Trachymyrmex septentrionalis]